MSHRIFSSAMLIIVLSVSFLACDLSQTQNVVHRIPTKSAINPSTTQLTSHFVTWLNANGYSSYNFAQGAGFSYGGKTGAGDTPVNQPVILIHGNSDKAVGTTTGQTGWTATINYLQSNGYKSSEVYAITWGPADALQSSNQYHSKPYLTRIRAFIQAVKAYTGATKVDVIGHSMGVTLARKAIKGGAGNDALNGGSYNLGTPLTYIDTFVGIAGANKGLTSCYLTGPTTPTCGSTNGLYPGYLIGLIGPYGVSSFLTALNADTTPEATYRYSIWSSVDEVVGGACLVYGANTCRVPNQTGQKSYSTYPYGHFGLKDLTTSVQLNMILNHNPN
jgi:hypothetical protein